MAASSGKFSIKLKQKITNDKVGRQGVPKKKNWNSATVFGGIVYFVNIRHYANFQIYRPINDTEHPT